ncbi:2956_t:CDS:2 [Dentiscutata heterogama]|uniref:2956_t:CDS:1 n=1 Tax=Dentiscutata heterogama TaxID=1316150 RepID=A0ACA9M0E7_9GLOM|nr:2956_t:CDS:2 [Dentiscutata heterogama]
METQTDSWSPSNYSYHARYVSTIPQDLISLLSPKSHERILDLGCGDGVLTFQIQQMCKECIGIDKSPRMIEAARSAGCKDVRVVDGEKLKEWSISEGFEGTFDAVFSNADQEAVVEGIRTCLKPSGRLVLEMGGKGNVQVIERSMISALDKRGYNGASLSPWVFPSKETFSALLTNASFQISSINLFPRPTYLPTNLRGWIDTFGNQFIQNLDDKEREDVINEVIKMCKPEVYNEKDGSWMIMYVRLRVLAYLV